MSSTGVIRLSKMEAHRHIQTSGQWSMCNDLSQPPSARVQSVCLQDDVDVLHLDCLTVVTLSGEEVSLTL
jgi:hypothetical protein